MSDVTIIDGLQEPQLWSPWLGADPSSWSSWFAFLRVLFGLPMSDAEIELFRQCTRRTTPLPGGYTEATLVIGRRGGKSLTLALIAVYLACFRQWPGVAGERMVVLVAASTARQARATHSYARSLISDVPALASKLVRETATELDLDNGISIVIEPADYRSIRGATVVAALLDECAFWLADGANPDKEVVTAVRAGMASVPGAMLLAASSPYAKKGFLFEQYRKHYGKDKSRVLCWQAPTRTMNPTIPLSVVDQALEDDPQAARSEYLAQFRDDIATFVDREVVEAAVVAGRREIPPGTGGFVNLFAAVDPAGGAGKDSYAMSVSGKDAESGKLAVLCHREVRPPFSPEAVTEEFAKVIKSYGLFEATCDKFAGSWPAEQFAKHGITLIPAKISSETFIDFLPLLMSRRVELPDDKIVVSQISNLERRTGRGRDYIAAGGTGHDDVAVVIAASIVRAAREEPTALIVSAYVADGPTGIGERGTSDFEARMMSDRRPDPYGHGPGNYFLGSMEHARQIMVERAERERNNKS